MKNHTERETIAEYVTFVVGLLSVVAIFQLHQWWGWIVFAVCFGVGSVTYRRANNRAARPPAA